MRKGIDEQLVSGEGTETRPVDKARSAGVNGSAPADQAQAEEIVSRVSPRILRPLVGGLVSRFGHDQLTTELMLAASGSGQVDPFARGIASASDLPPATEPPRLWFGVYRGSVSLLIGETGAGKSSLLYNFALHAARNEALYGVEFGLKRPLRVLYIDPENAGNWEEGVGGICALRLDRIDQGRPKDLFFHDGRSLNLADPAHVSALGGYLERERIDICILDPIANLFSTEDENDNAEAARQMKAMGFLSRKTSASLIPCHHTGKDNSGNYGRGASARLGSADVGMVFRVRSDSGERDDDYQGEPMQRDDRCRLQIVKNRWEGSASLFLQMAGNDKFNRIKFEDWKSSGSEPLSKVERCAVEIRHYLVDDTRRSRGDVLAAMKDEGFGRNTTDKALSMVVDEEEFDSVSVDKNQFFYWRIAE